MARIPLSVLTAVMLSAPIADAHAADPAVIELKSRIYRLEAEIRNLAAERRALPPPAAPASAVPGDLGQRLRTLELVVTGMAADIAALKARLPAPPGEPGEKDGKDGKQPGR